ncbi:hypothetical protein FRB96_003293 [Tulasnella sp. 330]|nr:hypothetical protein FRB96_003293 [Tulasnella sp. 330]KAG8872998.1 hypothetical protein FRB97_007130 [Tulasnella sp. 331]KAG8876735.1 hypothetical protein FRB98_007078 [Tulasnella sp. 332]
MAEHEHLAMENLEDKKFDNSNVHIRDVDKEQSYENPLQGKTIEEVTGADYDDPNLDPDAMGDFEDDSPYPEVRSAVANTDDVHMPVGTIRAWVIGLMWAILIPGLNQFFFFRYPSVTIGPLVAQLLSFPLGRALAIVTPDWSIFGARLNPGPFSIKEHVLITIMASVGSGSAYATDVVAVQRVFYNQRWSFAYQWLITMSTQLIGFSIGGIMRRFLVSPPSMIWPANLVYAALFNTLHQAQYAGAGDRGGMSRERFFTYACAFSFFWYFLPGYLFSALSYFSWVCWIAPNNVVVNQLFGVVHGLGGSLLTFDWSQIAYIGSPLATPWWAEANVAAGFFFFFWVLTPILYYTNTWYGSYLPISSRGSYDNKGAEYNVTRILNHDSTLNMQEYKQYSPLFLSTVFALSYGLSFASITATAVHAYLYFRKQIWTQARRSLSEQPDIHARLMSKYKEVPEWWYGLVFITQFTFAVIALEVWHTQFPIYAFVVALLVAFVYSIPIGMIQAITNQQIGLNVITELIIGYWLPGKPLTMMLFKTYGYITMAQALTFASDMKLGHYMKIPPRTMFWGQVWATVIAGTVQLAVQAWMFTNIPGMCTNGQPSGFICPNTQTFGTASIIWGVIGPKLQFSHGQVYYALTFAFLIGAVAPAIPYFLTKKYPTSIFKYVNLPVIFNGTGSIPPASAINYVPWAIVGFIFQFVIRRRHFTWWAKYNYVLSAAMDSGLALSVVFIFFVLQFPKEGTIGLKTVQAWWGNTVYTKTADSLGTPYLPLPAKGYFGPESW